jgi:hypothetical protein
MNFFHSVFVLATALVLQNFAFADTPGVHPALLHSLSDLRAARWHLDHRGGSDALKKADHDAVEEIDKAIDDVKKAATDDGKNLKDHPAEDAGKDKVGNVHRARELVEKAKKDIMEKDSNDATKALRDSAAAHLDEALKHIEESLKIGK